MKIGILLADELREALQHGFGSYADMFEHYLGGRGFTFTVYDIRADHFPAAPDEQDGYIITGSRHGVYEELAWLPPLFALIRRLVAARIPLLGICFGHQAIARALGGQADKSDNGWGLGLQKWAMTESASWMTPPPQELRLLASHQDQVLALPPDARLLGGSDFCPNAVYSIGDTVFSMQGHPEFSPAFAKALLPYRREDITDEEYQHAADSMDEPSDNAVCADWIEQFFRVSDKN